MVDIETLQTKKELMTITKLEFPQTLSNKHLKY